MTLLPGVKRAALLTFMAGALLTGVAATWQAQYNAERATTRFATVSRQATELIHARMAIYEYGLRGTRGAALAAGLDRFNSHEFNLYAQTREIDVEFPGARGFGVIRRVPVAEQDMFLGEMWRKGRPDFAIRQLAPHDRERFIIEYVEPVRRNAAAIGLDVASEENRRMAAVTAMQTGEATLTGPITLVQATGKPLRSFLLLLPIYRSHMDLSTPKARQEAAFGWSYAPLVIDEVLRGFDFHAGEFVLSLSDRADANGAGPFFNADGPELAAAGGPSVRMELPLYGRVWQAEFKATPLFMSALNLRDPRWMALLGLGLSGLLSTLAGLYAGRVERAARMRQAQDHLAAVVAASGDAIISASLDGCIISWNPAAERLFGYEAHEALGTQLEALLSPASLPPDEATTLARIQAGERVVAFDTVRARRDGSVVEVSISAVPLLDTRGRIVGVAETLRDIGLQKAAERQLSQSHAELEAKVVERTLGLEAARRDLQTILDALPSMVGYWDQDLVNRFANRAYVDWFGVGPTEVAGQHMRDFLGAELFERNRPFVEGALRGEPQTFERALARPDGPGHRHSLAHYLPDVVDGVVRGFYVLVHDVTELRESRQLASAATRRSEALLNLIQRHAIFSITDRAGRIIDANDAFCEISGFEREELVGQTHRIVNSGVHGAQFWVDVWRTISAGTSWRGQLCNRAKDGSIYWVDSIIAPFIGEDGRVENYVSVRFDITAAKLAERALRESEAFLERTGRVAGVGGWEYDMGTQAVKWSPEVYRIHEVDPSQTPSLASALGFYSPADSARIEQAMAHAIAHGKGWDLELPFISASGQRKWVRTVGEAELERGKPTRLLGAFQDITTQKLTQELLQVTSDRFSLASDAAGLGVWEYDLRNQSLIWDDWMYRLYARTRGDDVKPDSLWADNLHPDDRQRRERELDDAVSGRSNFDTEFRIFWPDGQVRHLKACALVQRDTAGLPVRMVGIVLDVTTRKKAEEDLSRTAAMLGVVLESATEVSIVAVDTDGMITLFNSGAERLLGYDRAEVVGKMSSMAFHDEDELRRRAAELSAKTGRHVRTGLALVDEAALGERHEWSYLRKDGKLIRVSLSVTAMLNDKGECFGYLGAAYDVTRQKATEDSLREAAAAAQRASVAKSQFLANMSHEIRTPLNAVIGVAHLLADTRLDDDQRQLLAKSQVAGRSLLGIVNDVLDLAKIEAGEMVVDKEPLSPGDLLLEVGSMFKPQADAKGLRLEVRCADKVPRWVVGDAQRLRQVLVNLVGNAMKFTSHGSVRMNLTVVHPGEAGNRLRFAVCDTGIGISAEAQDRLFVSFAQADASTTRRFGGTGLGLSIVRQLARLMGGDVGVISQAGEGSEFWMELPLLLPTKAQAESRARSQARFEVVVVDDHAPDRQALESHARALGWRVKSFDSGAALVDDIGERLANGDALPDALIVDQQMVGMSGLQALTVLSARLGRDKLPPSLVVTAHEAASIRELDSQHLAEGVLHKPVGASELFNAVNDGVARRTGSTDKVLKSIHADTPEARWLPGVRLLVVDDSDINREVARRLLEREGARVCCAASGLEALTFLRAEDGAFDAVLMDVQMPDMDGLDATRRIRGELALKLPVIALTAGALVEEQRRALAAGMDDFLSKPLDPQDLIRTLRREIERHRGVRLSVLRVRADEADLRGWPQIAGVDAAEAARCTSGDAVLFTALLGRMLKEFADFARLDLAAPESKTARSEMAARMHKLRGSAGTLGAGEVHRHATEAEMALGGSRAAAAWPLAALGQSLKALSEAAAPMLAGAALDERASAQSGSERGAAVPAATPQECDELLRLIERQQMAALDRFEVLAPGLSVVYGAQVTAKAKEALDDLNFGAALALFKAYEPA